MTYVITITTGQPATLTGPQCALYFLALATAGPAIFTAICWAIVRITERR